MENLAIKYRPTTFEEVCGQSSIIKILNKQIEVGSFKNCYLFSGPSGCGKTTLARIMANKINKGLGTPEEIDGASNNGVDNVRMIIDSAVQRSLDSEYKVYIIDECFTGETVITTANGPKKIKNITPGDRVLTLKGFNKVSYVHTKKVGNSMLNLLKLSDGRVVNTTADHLFLTTDGWIESKNLKNGDILLDEKNMLELWKRIPDQTQNSEVLQQQVSDDVSVTSVNKGFNREDLSYLWEYLLCGKKKQSKEDLLYGMQEKVNIAIREDNNEFRIWDGTKETIIYKNDKEESNEGFAKYRENAFNERIEWDSSSMEREKRGKWLIYRTSTYAMESIRRFLEIGVSNKDELLREQSKQVSYIIQSRPWLSRDKISDRGGWQESSIEKYYCKRYKENRMSGEVRVESVEIYQPGDTGGSSTGITKDTILYDLTVEGSPTYYANGVLVHNCHMITTAGWNAFLKCIEEPPKYTIFMFCTTDPQKVPTTIVNRCQVFNLGRISDDGIIHQLDYICNKEKISFTIDSLEYICKMSNGSMRQAITYLDKAKDFSTNLTLENVVESLGNYSYDIFFDLVNARIDNDKQKTISIIESLYNQGSDLKIFINNYLDFILDLSKYCIFKTTDVIKIPKSMEEKIKYTVNLDDNIKFFNMYLDKVLSIKQSIKNDINMKTTIEVMLMGG